MDEIRIDNLEIYAGHGVYEDENASGQPFFVNAVLYTDTREAGWKDALALSTHYGEVSHLLNRYLREHTFRLIEAAAERAAEQVLLHFPRILSLDLEIRKPKAPIGLPFASVSVKISRGWKKAYLGIGSNMGDREGYIRQALERLRADQRIRKVCVSQLITTAPYGGVEQEDFLNGAIGLETLDLDLLLFEGFVSDDPRLTIPHPDMHNRRFVLEPLAQLCPYGRHPVLGKSVGQLLEELKE